MRRRVNIRLPVLSCVVIALLLALGAGGVAAKKKPKKKKPDRGTLVYGKGKALWRSPATGGKATKVATLGFAAKRIDQLRASETSTLGRTALLVSTSENHYWVELTPDNANVPVVRHVCRGTAAMSRDGGTVLCMAKDGAIALVTTSDADKKTSTAVRGKLATLAGSTIDEVVVATPSGIEAVKIADSKKRRSLGNVTPASNLLIAPDGKRAVAVFDEAGGGTGLYSFLLDGKGVRRKLVTDAAPVAWSSDSRWLVVSRKKRGCVVRATGGQYRCFAGYRALGIAPDQKDALLTSGSKSSLTLFRADLGGARSSTPAPLIRKAQGSAIWLAPR